MGNLILTKGLDRFSRQLFTDARLSPSHPRSYLFSKLFFFLGCYCLRIIFTFMHTVLSGTPKTAISSMPGWVCKNSSTSLGYIFSPPLIIISYGFVCQLAIRTVGQATDTFILPTILQQPSSSSTKKQMAINPLVFPSKQRTCQISSVHPTSSIYRLLCLFLVVPIALHHRVTEIKYFFSTL